jgi:DNA-binding MarR family transcriptional regulator
MHAQTMRLKTFPPKLLLGRGIMLGVTPPDPRDDDPSLVAAWHEVMDRHARVSSALEKALQRQHGLGLSEFEVLERLHEIEHEPCRMQVLSDAAHLSQSALSRLISRLEADGLVYRSMCEHDRRGIFAHLTEDGRARYEAARPTHRAVLAATLPAPTGS